MPAATPRPVRRLVPAVALALLLALLPGGAGAQDDGPVVIDLDLTAGDVTDPVETSILWSRVTFDAAEEAVIATAADGADALASGSLQSGVGGAMATTVEGEEVTARPLFFVDPDVGPEEALLAELERLGTTSLILLGGTAAIPQDVVDDLTDAGFTDLLRLEGATRTATAVAIAEYVIEASDTATVFLSRAFGTATIPETAYADSTALGGWAAATGDPILLTATDDLSADARVLLESGDVDRVEIIGGTAAVGEGVEEAVRDLDLQVARHAGDSRDQTAVAIAQARGADDADDVDRIIITEGFATGFFENAFAAAAHSGLFDAPVLLTNGLDLTPAAEAFIEGSSRSFALAETGVVGVCGTDVPLLTCNNLAGRIGADRVAVTLEEEPEPPEVTIGDIAVSPLETQVVRIRAEEGPGDEVTYTASGLDPDSTYRVTLHHSSRMAVGAGGAVFADAEDDGAGDGIADQGPAEAVALITHVDGTALETPATTVPDPGEEDGPAAAALAPDAEGTITVTMDAIEAGNGGAVFPVIVEQGGASTFLEVDGDGVPTEAYGVGAPLVVDARVGDLNLVPHVESTVTVNMLLGNDSEGDEVTFAVGGLDADLTYRITLVPAANVTVSADGATATFATADDDGTTVVDADGAEDIGTITLVNGEAPASTGGGGSFAPADGDPGIAPTNGVITFQVDGTDGFLLSGETGSLRPVVSVLGGASPALELTDAGVPTEAYGVGGLFTTEGGV